MTEKEKIELEIRRSLNQLRHLYNSMMNGDLESQCNIEHFAIVVLSPALKRLEALADSLVKPGDLNE